MHAKSLQRRYLLLAIKLSFRHVTHIIIIYLQPLDAASLKEVESALAGFLKKGQSLVLTTSVDPSIIGGMIVVIGDRYVDMSLSTKIQKYSELMQQAI